ncbi:hypothetical protein PS025_24690, partial [Shigella sonnei]|nr:hypothetical protein [Shigella sonnei]
MTAANTFLLAFDNASKKVFAAVTDRVNREANKGYLYSFNSDSLYWLHDFHDPGLVQTPFYWRLIM